MPYCLILYINLFFDSLISQISLFDRLTASRDFETKLRTHLLDYIHLLIHFYLAYTYTLLFITIILLLFYCFIVLFCSITLFESLLFLLPFAGPKPVVTASLIAVITFFGYTSYMITLFQTSYLKTIKNLMSDTTSSNMILEILNEKIAYYVTSLQVHSTTESKPTLTV